MTGRSWLIFVALYFWLHETAHFGWNMTAQSDAELVCDGISLVLLAIAISHHEKKS